MRRKRTGDRIHQIFQQTFRRQKTDVETLLVASTGMGGKEEVGR